MSLKGCSLCLIYMCVGFTCTVFTFHPPRKEAGVRQAIFV